MKLFIASGALFLGALVFALRPPGTQTVIVERKVEVPVRIETPVASPSPRVEKESPPVRAAERPLLQARPEPSGPALACEKMLFLFERELDLQPSQRQHMAEVLRTREKEIEAYHEEVRASGVFREREYTRRVREIQDRCYERMGDVLDERQHRRFLEVLAHGKLGDAIEFEVGPEMVVIPE